MHEAIDSSGAGSGGTRNISGTSHYHVLLEEELADLHNKEGSTYYLPRDIFLMKHPLSTIASILPDCVVLSDELNHASMIQGMKK